ncbi:MAG TPA: exodeoxyribonuclease VII large subunit, partial [Anaerolineae bacterium]
TALESLQRALRLANPRNQVLSARQRLTEWQTRLASAVLSQFVLQREQLRGLSGRLATVSPLSTLARGYAIVQRERDEVVVRSVQDVQAGDRLRIRVSDGEFGASA